MKITISRVDFNRIYEHALSVRPEEACGLIAGEDRDSNGPVPGFGFIDVSFRPGLVGIEIGSIDVPAETYRYLLDILQQYQTADLR